MDAYNENMTWAKNQLAEALRLLDRARRFGAPGPRTDKRIAKLSAQRDFWLAECRKEG